MLNKKKFINLLIPLLIILGIFYTYYSFKPHVDTTSILESASEKSSVDSLFSKLESSKSETISLSSEELSTIAAYSISKNGSISTYVKGIKILPKDNNLKLYLTVHLAGITSQVKMNFEILSNSEAPTLKYTKGSIGFIPIKVSDFFPKLNDTQYLTIDKENGTISLKPTILKNNLIKKFNISNSNLNIELIPKK